MSRLKSKLWLEALDGRVLPDAAPIGTPPASPPPQTSDQVKPGTAQFDFSGWKADGPTTIDIVFRDKNGKLIHCEVEVGANTTPAQVADAIYRQIIAQGGAGVTLEPPATLKFDGVQDGPLDIIISHSNDKTMYDPGVKLVSVGGGLVVNLNGKKIKPAIYDISDTDTWGGNDLL